MAQIFYVRLASLKRWWIRATQIIRSRLKQEDKEFEKETKVSPEATALPYTTGSPTPTPTATPGWVRPPGPRPSARKRPSCGDRFRKAIPRGGTWLQNMTSCLLSSVLRRFMSCRFGLDLANDLPHQIRQSSIQEQQPRLRRSCWRNSCRVTTFKTGDRNN